MSGFLDIWSGNREKCPNCGNAERNVFLYKCKDVLCAGGTLEESDVSCHEKIFCEQCGGQSHECPDCGLPGEIVGRTDPEAKYYVKEIATDPCDPPSSRTRVLKGFGFLLFVFFIIFLWVIIPGKKETPQKVAPTSADTLQHPQK